MSSSREISGARKIKSKEFGEELFSKVNEAWNEYAEVSETAEMRSAREKELAEQAEISDSLKEALRGNVPNDLVLEDNRLMAAVSGAVSTLIKQREKERDDKERDLSTAVKELLSLRESGGQRLDDTEDFSFLYYVKKLMVAHRRQSDEDTDRAQQAQKKINGHIRATLSSLEELANIRSLGKSGAPENGDEASILKQQNKMMVNIKQDEYMGKLNGEIEKLLTEGVSFTKEPNATDFISGLTDPLQALAIYGAVLKIQTDELVEQTKQTGEAEAKAEGIRPTLLEDFKEPVIEEWGKAIAGYVNKLRGLGAKSEDDVGMIKGGLRPKTGNPKNPADLAHAQFETLRKVAFEYGRFQIEVETYKNRYHKLVGGGRAVLKKLASGESSLEGKVSLTELRNEKLDEIEPHRVLELVDKYVWNTVNQFILTGREVEKAKEDRLAARAEAVNAIKPAIMQVNELLGILRSHGVDTETYESRVGALLEQPQELEHLSGEYQRLTLQLGKCVRDWSERVQVDQHRIYSLEKMLTAMHAENIGLKARVREGRAVQSAEASPLEEQEKRMELLEAYIDNRIWTEFKLTKETVEVAFGVPHRTCDRDDYLSNLVDFIHKYGDPLVKLWNTETKSGNPYGKVMQHQNLYKHVYDLAGGHPDESYGLARLLIIAQDVMSDHKRIIEGITGLQVEVNAEKKSFQFTNVKDKEVGFDQAEAFVNNFYERLFGSNGLETRMAELKAERKCLITPCHEKLNERYRKGRKKQDDGRELDQILFDDLAGAVETVYKIRIGDWSDYMSIINKKRPKSGKKGEKSEKQKNKESFENAFKENYRRSSVMFALAGRLPQDYQSDDLFELRDSIDELSNVLNAYLNPGAEEEVQERGLRARIRSATDRLRRGKSGPKVYQNILDAGNATEKQKRNLVDRFREKHSSLLPEEVDIQRDYDTIRQLLEEVVPGIRKVMPYVVHFAERIILPIYSKLFKDVENVEQALGKADELQRRILDSTGEKGLKNELAAYAPEQEKFKRDYNATYGGHLSYHEAKVELDRNKKALDELAAKRGRLKDVAGSYVKYTTGLMPEKYRRENPALSKYHISPFRNYLFGKNGGEEQDCVNRRLEAMKDKFIEVLGVHPDSLGIKQYAKSMAQELKELSDCL